MLIFFHFVIRPVNAMATEKKARVVHSTILIEILKNLHYSDYLSGD
ncbi:hypothetical protein GJA_3115 [Janthinobacterium agaricidamnosum NBRC 102515 = DSM 9628]|uniref:Uncharacterized protein n=1 Tax=Janthinobacterium agaricidamnosum NBRC 102515 = DSM 9628 TaxID=1349767 RepID=W0V7Y9_9BURK|nr:hypothetical protein GJA_3115 [Janthinobacterium agaricidamnosum NBRC 102515 = DSM 9628]